MQACLGCCTRTVAPVPDIPFLTVARRASLRWSSRVDRMQYAVGATWFLRRLADLRSGEIRSILEDMPTEPSIHPCVDSCPYAGNI